MDIEISEIETNVRTLPYLVWSKFNEMSTKVSIIINLLQKQNWLIVTENRTNIDKPHKI